MRAFARDLVLLPSIDLALLVAEVRLVAASAQSQRPRRSSFGLAGEAEWASRADEGGAFSLRRPSPSRCRRVSGRRS